MSLVNTSKRHYKWFKILLWEKQNHNHASLLRELKESNTDYFNKLADEHIA
jgi:hypothetical protein